MMRNYSANFVDMHGNPVACNPVTNPYNFDAYVVWRKGKNEEITHTLYSDRLIGEFTNEALSAAKKKNFKGQGDSFDGFKPKQIEGFLSELYKKPVRMIILQKCCNLSSGYPIWIFQFSMAS